MKLAAKLTDRAPEEICRKAGIPLLLSTSIKAGLDIDWSDARQKATAIQIVEQQVASLERWVDKHLDDLFERPLLPYLEAITTIREQDLEPTEKDGVRIRQGVAADRRISIEDAEMRHGRKSRSKRFDGYKEHIAYDLDRHVILACAVTPANRPEEEGAAPIAEDIDHQGFTFSEVHVDRAYVNSPLVATVQNDGGTVFAKPWAQRAIKPGLFSKADFRIDLRAETITCPAGEVEPFEPGETVHFDPEVCGACPLRANCVQAASGKDEASRSPGTRRSKTSSASCKRPRRGALHSASVLPSSILWLISRLAKGTVPGTLACARTCSTCDALLPSRTSKRPSACTGWRRKYLKSMTVQPVRCSRAIRWKDCLPVRTIAPWRPTSMHSRCS